MPQFLLVLMASILAFTSPVQVQRFTVQRACGVTSADAPLLVRQMAAVEVLRTAVINVQSSSFIDPEGVSGT